MEEDDKVVITEKPDYRDEEPDPTIYSSEDAQ